MRIAIVCYPTYGGSGVVATELGQHLARRGHKIHFVSSAMPFRLSHAFQENIYYHEVDRSDYPLFDGANLYTLALSAKLHQLIQLENLDLIHLHYAIPHSISAYLAKQMSLPRHVPSITTLHGTDITLVGQEPAFHATVRFGIDQSDAVTAVSDWLRVETEKNFGVRRSIDVIHNFFDINRFVQLAPDCCPRGHFAKPDEKIVLHVSNFRKVKRIPDVIETFAKIVERAPAKLLMVGDGPERAAAQRLAQRLGVMDRVWFLGKQDVVEPYYVIADLLLFPSEHESFGLSAVEGMASRTPVVASDGGALPEIIQHGVEGLLAPVGDVEGFAAHGVRLLSDPEYAQQISEAAYRKVTTLYSPDRIVSEYEHLYQRVMESAPVDPTVMPEYVI